MTRLQNSYILNSMKLNKHFRPVFFKCLGFFLKNNAIILLGLLCLVYEMLCGAEERVQLFPAFL